MHSLRTTHMTSTVMEMHHQCCMGILLPAKWIDSHGTDSTADKELIWCTPLLRGRQSFERMALSNALPLHAEVAYYNPREEENPTDSVPQCQ